ncbi:MAG: hypothetical protein Q9215_005084 [Flavoplaca cf. flavocitrina]
MYNLIYFYSTNSPYILHSLPLAPTKPSPPTSNATAQEVQAFLTDYFSFYHADRTQAIQWAQNFPVTGLYLHEVSREELESIYGNLGLILYDDLAASRPPVVSNTGNSVQIPDQNTDHVNTVGHQEFSQVLGPDSTYKDVEGYLTSFFARYTNNREEASRKARVLPADGRMLLEMSMRELQGVYGDRGVYLWWDLQLMKSREPQAEVTGSLLDWTLGAANSLVGYLGTGLAVSVKEKME